MNLTDRRVLDSFRKEERAATGRTVLAPCLGDGRGRFRVGVTTCHCRLASTFVGWAILRIRQGPGGAFEAEFEREAEVWEKEQYLESLPGHSLVLLQPGGRGRWWACEPARGGVVALDLVEGAEVFDTAVGRADGPHCWFGGLDATVPAHKAERMRQASTTGQALERLDPAGLKPRDRALYQAVTDLRPEPESEHIGQRIARSLELGEGRLVGFTEVQGGYRVTWEKGSQRLQTVVDRNLSVVAAGLCLDGEDYLQDLTSLASLIPKPPRWWWQHAEEPR
jgi:hypothetical protein